MGLRFSETDQAKLATSYSRFIQTLPIPGQLTDDQRKLIPKSRWSSRS